MRTYLICKGVALICLVGSLFAYGQAPRERVHIRIAPGTPGMQVNATPGGVTIEGQGPMSVTSTDVDRILARFVALEEAVLKLAEAVGKSKSSPRPKPTPKPKVPPKADPTTERDEPSLELTALLVRNCHTCHAPAFATKMGGGFVMFETLKDGEKLPSLKHLTALNWVRIDYSVYSGDMPQFGDPLPSDEVEEVRAYVNSFRHEVYSGLDTK